MRLLLEKIADCVHRWFIGYIKYSVEIYKSCSFTRTKMWMKLVYCWIGWFCAYRILLRCEFWLKIISSCGQNPVLFKYNYNNNSEGILLIIKLSTEIVTLNFLMNRKTFDYSFQLLNYTQLITIKCSPLYVSSLLVNFQMEKKFVRCFRYLRVSVWYCSRSTSQIL